MRLISKSTAVALIAAMAALAPVVARAQADQEAVKKNLLAAQGSLAIFVIEIAVYAYLMNKLDRKYGIDEGGAA